MSRRNARDIAFKLIFGYLFNKDILFSDFIKMEEISDLSEEESGYINSAFEGVKSNFDYLKKVIAENLKDYEIERIYKVDLSILLFATYELVFVKDLGVSVIVNEAVNIAKKYSTEKSSVFINGVLSSIVRQVR